MLRNSPRFLSVAVLFLYCTSFLHSQGPITTIAGNGLFRFTGNGGPATNAPLGRIGRVATDPTGNVYAVDLNNQLVVKISPAGLLTIVAGNGTQGYSGDGGPALNASFLGIIAVAADGAGNVFILDNGALPEIFPSGVCVVRRVDGGGTISTFAGTVGCGYSGDGGPAAQAQINRAQGISVDLKGNLYIADTGNNRVRKITPEGIISTVAGNGQCCYTGDGVQAASTALNSPYGVAADPNGVLYIADTFNDRVRRVGTDGFITTIAGGNGRGYSGDGGPARASMLNWPAGVALDSGGNLYIADMFNHRVRRVAPDGIIQTIAGNGTANFTGDGGSSQLATLNTPSGIASDAAGNIYIADSMNLRVRRVDPSGTITTFAGDGNYGFGGDGGQARAAILNRPSSVLVDPSGNVFISDTENNRVRKIAPNGVITTFAGGAAGGLAGDDGPATKALLRRPVGLALDSAGDLYIADSGNARVRKVDRNGTITTFVGNGASPGNGIGDGGPARDASFNSLYDIAFDTKGNLYIADPLAGRIREVSPGGTIRTLATGLFFPTAVTVDAADNVYASVGALQVSTRGGGVARISPNGTTTYLVSNFLRPGKIAIDAQGNLYVPESATIPGPTVSQVIEVSPGGAETVIAGSGEVGFTGDEGPASLAQLSSPTGVALDSAGNLYIADNGNNRIRKVFLNPASGLFQPNLQMTLDPGFYIAEVRLGEGEHAGYWGMEFLAPLGVLAGEFYLGGAIQQHNSAPGFGAIYLPFSQTVHVHVDARAADGGDNSTVGLGVRLLDASRTPMIPEQFGGASVDFTQMLPTGFYIFEVRGGEDSPIGNFQMVLGADQIAGGLNAGGFAKASTIGFAAFHVPTAQQVMIRVLGQPSYGAAGAGGLRLTLRDANRNVIATVPEGARFQP